MAEPKTPQERRTDGEDGMGEQRGQNVPVPDPSTMTTRQLQREIFALRELIEAKQGSSEHVNELMGQVISARLEAGENANNLGRTIIETRLDGMDKAIKLLQDTADKFPGRIDEKITSLKQVHEEKFAAMLDTHSEKFSSIQTQFKERDVRTEQSSKDSKVAVDAALQAAKEAVGEQNKSSALAIAKSETSTTKQIDQLAVSIQQLAKTFDDKVVDVKDRLTRIEGKGEGTDKTESFHQSTTRDFVMMTGIIFATLFGLAGLVVAILTYVRHP